MLAPTVLPLYLLRRYRSDVSSKNLLEMNRRTPRANQNMLRVSETRHTQATQPHSERHITTNNLYERPVPNRLTTKTTTSGKKLASSPAPQPRGVLANKNSKPPTPTRPRTTTTHEATRRPSSQSASAKIVPGRKTHLQTMAIRPTTDGRCEWKLKVEGPTPGRTIVEHGVAVRSGDRITTALFRVEHLSGGRHKSSDRKAAGGSSGKRSAGHRVTFQ